MTEPVTSTTDIEKKTENNSRKRVRHRKRLLYEKLLKQMEFYFSDANLSKDRFLGELTKRDPFVQLEIFLKFNKIKELTNDINDIAKALKHSTLLELSEEKSKVKRKTPVLSYDADIRTIYVESIPVTANRDWVEKVFSDYGKVAYISLPKFKTSQKIKGYGFVEFEQPESAQKCIQAFTEMGCKLPTSMQPEELSSIKTFSAEEMTANDNKNPETEDEPPKKKAKKNKDKKAKHSISKQSLESDNEGKSETQMECQTAEADSKDEATSHDESSKVNEDGLKKKNLKKKLTKEKDKTDKNCNKNEAPKGALWGLQVLSKGEWKVLRNRYLNLQRKYMREMKMNIRNNAHSHSNIPPPAVPSADTANPEMPKAKAALPLERIPGLFVKDVLVESCQDVRLTKRNLKSNAHILHVDVKEGQTDVILRFDSPESAKEYCAASGQARVLTGAEESEQWERALNARVRGRGRQRVVARAAHDAAPDPAPASPCATHTHLRFDDE